MTQHNKDTSLLRYLKPYSTRLALLAVLFAANIILQILIPQLLSRFIDAAEGGGLLTQLIWLIIMYLLAAGSASGVNAALSYASQALGCLVTDDYRLDVMSHFLRLNMQTHKGWRSGESMTRLDEDVQGMYKYYHILIFKLTSSGIMLVCVLAVLLWRSPALAGALLAVSLLAIAGFRWIQERGVAKYVRAAAASAEFGGVMKEMVDNAAEVRSYAAEGYMEHKLRAAMKHRFRESFPASLMYGNLWSASTIMQGLVLAASLGVGMYLWGQGLISVGMVYLLFTYSDLIISPLQDFRNHMGELQGARAGMARVADMMALPAEDVGGAALAGADNTVRSYPNGKASADAGSIDHSDVGGAGSTAASGSSLNISGLRFAYNGGDEVLRGIDLCVPAGGSVCLTGETGCGKSTLMGLIARLYTFTEGDIRLDGMDIRTLSPNALRGAVAYVTQSPQLLHASLRDNITFYDPSISDGAIHAAVASLGLTEWFSRMPDGLDTLLDMGEGSLSSGEAQFIALIRMALRNPRLILLDEFTARLDAATEQRVMAAVRALCAGRTVAAVAHRAAAMSWMERVVRIESGVIIGEAEADIQ